MAQFDRFNMFEAMAPIYQARDARDQQQFQNAFAMQKHADDQQYRAASMDMQRQELGLSRERLDMAKQQIEMSMLETLQQMDAEQQARELEELTAERQAIGAALGAGDMQALQALGLESPEAAEAMLAATESVLARAAGVTAMMDARPKAPEPPAAFQALEARAAAAGMQPGTPEYADFMARGGKVAEGMRIESTPGGGFSFVQGEGVNGDAPKPLSSQSPEAMVLAIDGILSDPALPYATGVLAPAQNIPGTGARRVGARMNQLEGQAFLQAFESLKGGGQITEIEGQKATQAIARLDSYQSEADYRAALEELRDLLVLGNSRPEGWAERRRNEIMAPDVGMVEDGFRFLGGDPGNPDSWEPVQ